MRRSFPILSWQRELADWVTWAIIALWLVREFYVMQHPLVPGIKESPWAPDTYAAIGIVAVLVAMVAGAIYGTGISMRYWWCWQRRGASRKWPKATLAR